MLDPANLPDGTEWLGHLTDPLTPDYHLWLFKRHNRLVLRTRRTSTGSEGEREVPLAVAGWLHRTITQGFWRAPEDGGLERGTYAVTTTIANEKLELRRGWGIGGPGEPGFTLTNFNRIGVLGTPEELMLSDELLIKGGLLDLLGTLR